MNPAQSLTSASIAPAGRDREPDRYLGHGESEPDGRE
jgi:hypothetical protein